MAEILAFSASQVGSLTGLSMRQLAYWDRTGFFAPSYAEDERRSPFARVYSFRDVVGLRAVAQMRSKYRISLQQLRQVGAFLAKRYESPWSQLTFYIVGRRVFYQEEKAIRSADQLGQTALPFEMVRVAKEVTRKASRMRLRRKREIGQITRDRHVAENRAVIAGTRTPTRAIWSLFLGGYSDDQILKEYPRLEGKDIQAAIDFEERRLAKST